MPPIWDAVRFASDQSPEPGQFILTGSATPAHKGILHSGTGRIGKFRMWTMSLYESDDSSGQVSLSALFSTTLSPIMTGEAALTHLINLTVRGGWPGSLNIQTPVSTDLAKSYLDTVTSNTKLASDIQEYEEESIDRNTVSSYLDIFRRLFILDDQPAFSPNFRSSIRVGKSSKRHYADPSLAAAALGLTPSMLFHDLHTFGFLFESLCERDLRIYAEANDGHLFHYRDDQNREIDAVVEMADGQWDAFEIKLGMNQIDQAAANLLSIKKAMKEHVPALLCVICGMSNMAYTRKDGVLVVPITALRE